MGHACVTDQIIFSMDPAVVGTWICMHLWSAKDPAERSYTQRR